MKKRFAIFGTALLLLIGFVLLIGIFFIFDYMSKDVLGGCVATMELNTPIMTRGVPPSLFDEGMPGSEAIAEEIRMLNKRKDVAAFVLTIDSPGGSVVATREIYDAINEFDKPKVAYIRETAASGGYYVATAFDEIVSHPNAIVGNIGVKATFIQMSGLLDKLGISVESVQSSDFKDLGAPYRNMTEEEKAIIQTLIDETYGEFREVVLEGRKGKIVLSKFDEATDGRIMSGRKAKEYGLVDSLGDRRDALMRAADLANISYSSYEDIRVCPVSPSYGDSSTLFSAETIVNLLLERSQGGLYYQ